MNRRHFLHTLAAAGLIIPVADRLPPAWEVPLGDSVARFQPTGPVRWGVRWPAMCAGMTGIRTGDLGLWLGDAGDDPGDRRAILLHKARPSHFDELPGRLETGAALRRGAVVPVTCDALRALFGAAARSGRYPPPGSP